MTVPVLQELYGESFNYEDKVTFSCAEDEIILQKIKSTGKKNIIVCGIEAHICVLQTVVDLIALGYHVILVEDCVGSRTEENRQIGIRRALQEGALSTSYESILFELTRVAKTDIFKSISRLIK
jgi:nicotinamidase-related amidase